MPANQRGEPFDHIFIKRGPGINPVSAHLVEQFVRQMIKGIGGLLGILRGTADGYVHLTTFGDAARVFPLAQSRKVAGTALIRLAVAILLRIRSLLIMMGDDSTSRSNRPTENSPSLR